MHVDEQPFVPKGVDTDSWRVFEQRIQQRRYLAVVERVRGAIAAGHRRAAEDALAEARALDPHAAELPALEAKAAALGRRARRFVPHLAVTITVAAALVLAIDSSRVPEAPPGSTRAGPETTPPPAPEPTTGIAGPPAPEPSSPRAARPVRPPPPEPRPAPAVTLSPHPGVDYALRRHARTFTGLPFQHCDVDVLDMRADGTCQAANGTWQVIVRRQGDTWILERASHLRGVR